VGLLKDLCVEYKRLSQEQQDKQDEIDRQKFEKKFIERSMDAEFERRLKDIDLEDDDSLPEENSNQKKQGAKLSTSTSSTPKK
jgi:hypothetical protein